MSRASSTVAVVGTSEKIKDSIMHLIRNSIKEPTEQTDSLTW